MESQETYDALMEMAKERDAIAINVDVFIYASSIGENASHAYTVLCSGLTEDNRNTGITSQEYLSERWGILTFPGKGPQDPKQGLRDLIQNNIAAVNAEGKIVLLDTELTKRQEIDWQERAAKIRLQESKQDVAQNMKKAKRYFVYPALVDAFDGRNREVLAKMIGQLSFWSGKGKDGDWVYKTDQEWMDEVRVSYEERKEATKILEGEMGLIETARKKLTNKTNPLHYRITPKGWDFLSDAFYYATEEMKEKTGD